MSTKTGWLPGKRSGIIDKAQVWQGILAVRESGWDIPPAMVTAFNGAVTVITAADAAEKADRGPHNVEAVQAAQKELVAQMRFLKNRYFVMPPLVPLDFIDLQLDVPGANHGNPIPKARNQAIVGEPSRAGAHMLKVKLSVAGVLPEGSKKSWYNYKIYFAVVDPEGASGGKKAAWNHIAAAPASGSDLPNSLATNRSTYIFDFPETDRGKAVWFSAVLENYKHEEGPWGTLFADRVP